MSEATNATARQARENVALTIGRLTLDAVEAQTAADALSTDNARLRAENDQLKARVAELTPKE